MLRPDDLANQTLVMLVGDQQPTNPNVAVWLHGLKQFGYRFRALHGANELRDCFLAVAAGAGIGLLPGSVLTDGDAGTTSSVGHSTRRSRGPTPSSPGERTHRARPRR